MVLNVVVSMLFVWKGCCWQLQTEAAKIMMAESRVIEDRLPNHGFVVSKNFDRYLVSLTR